MRGWFGSLRGNQRSQKWAQRARNERHRQCLAALALLQRYVDRDLDSGELARFERHVNTCRACGLETRVYRDIKSSLADRKGDPDRAASSRLRKFATNLRDDE